jgi:YbbR domain-containing protein
MTRIISFIRDAFTHEIYWKIISVIIAIILWFIVMNIINPTETKTFSTTIDLVSLNEFEEQGYTVLNYNDIKNTKVSIKIKGTRPALDDLKSNSTVSSVTATADLSGIQPSEDSTTPQSFSLKISPKVVENYVYSYEIVSYSPAFINAKVDRISTGNRNLNLNVTGKAASGYIADEPECDVDTVTIKGPASLVSNVAKVQASVDISGKTTIVDETAEVVVLDYQDNVIKEFSVEPKYVKVKVSVRKQGFLKINEPLTISQLPDGLKLESVDWYPKTIDVTGKSSALETIASLKLPSINLSEISSSVSYSYSVRKLLDGTGLSSDTTNIVVTVNVAADDNTTDATPVDISPKDITILSLPAGTFCNIEKVDIELQGDAQTILELKPEDINPSINLMGFEIGNHTVPVNLSLPDGITAAKNSAEIVISDSSEQTTETTTIEETTEAETEAEEISQTDAESKEEESTTE